MPEFVQATPCLDLAPLTGDADLVAWDVGPDRSLYLVLAQDDVASRQHGGSAGKVNKALHRKLRVVAARHGKVLFDVTLADSHPGVRHVQPLPDGELLLASSRSSYRSANDYDRNGRIYGIDGAFRREILLGDGINRMQATSDGLIWTGFFDEGIFGNYGWDDPVGASGLVVWDAKGGKLFDYHPEGLEPISDCYALNVESDTDTWLYYYTGFPLVHLNDRKRVSHWPMPVHGAGAFAIGHDYALFSGGYDERDCYVLFELTASKGALHVSTLSLADEAGTRVTADGIVGRGDTLYVQRGDRIYCCDIETAVGLAG